GHSGTAVDDAHRILNSEYGLAIDPARFRRIGAEAGHPGYFHGMEFFAVAEDESRKLQDLFAALEAEYRSTDGVLVDYSPERHARFQHVPRDFAVDLCDPYFRDGSGPGD